MDEPELNRRPCQSRVLDKLTDMRKLRSRRFEKFSPAGRVEKEIPDGDDGSGRGRPVSGGLDLAGLDVKLDPDKLSSLNGHEAHP